VLEGVRSTEYAFLATPFSPSRCSMLVKHPRPFFPSSSYPCHSTHRQHVTPTLFLLLSLLFNSSSAWRPSHLITSWLGMTMATAKTTTTCGHRVTTPTKQVITLLTRYLYSPFCLLAARPCVSGFNGDPHAPSTTPSFSPLCVDVIFVSMLCRIGAVYPEAGHTTPTFQSRAPWNGDALMTRDDKQHPVFFFLSRFFQGRLSLFCVDLTIACLQLNNDLRPPRAAFSSSLFTPFP
jgi:hypothetical protein